MITSVKYYSSKEDLFKDWDEDKREIAKADDAYYDEVRGNILFKLKTKFRWGRHHGNILQDVYKVEPTYIEWCIKSCSGFAIYEDDLKTLSESNVFDSEHLNKLIQIDSKLDNTYLIDLQSFKRDKLGFLIGDEITEHFHIIGFDLMKFNRDKLNKKLDFNNYQFGIPDNKINHSNLVLKGNGNKIKLIVK